MVDGHGCFVSLDGPSGVGKSTVSALLVGKLRSHDGITVPDVSVFLLGDPVVCVERAAARGQYSRFHNADVGEAIAELRAFSVAADALAAIGYPVHRHDISDTTADQVADALLPVVLAAKEGGS
ncbi:hypothetical protein [Umezawaea tangerina]|uniref:Thymidylate kinase n=1 Tax=Umezawaea tangerina TaxID=84725 RepID=A0A2T0SLN3_9PSEU|nr:hypothetical protein [Umezawaea tangerina]PRY34327.1 hypothetical protein CLV43_117101 [Umezawaea tangerina]